MAECAKGLGVIKIQYRPESLGYAVYEYRGNRAFKEFKQADGNWVQVKEGYSAPEPTLIIENLEEWAEAIRDAGVKLPSDHKLEGILEAQKAHLEDMRTLVFRRGKGLETFSNRKAIEVRLDGC